MKTTKEIKVGRRYTCIIRNRDSVVRVKEIDTRRFANHSTVRIICREEITGFQKIFRSPSQLIAELGEPLP